MPLTLSENIFSRRSVAIGIILSALLLCFASAEDSLFLFDDFQNLDALIHIQGESVFSPGFWEFVWGGNAGPTGRPVSLFSFALQADSWPDNPAAFKWINLIIHGLNGILVYLVCRQLCEVLKLQESDTWKIALFSSLIWALHPVHSSVVLYAVQRMALVSNFFILLGIFLYLHLRLSITAEKQIRQLVFMTLVLASTGLLALFSKENAPSLFFYLLALEYTLLRETHLPDQRKFFIWRYVVLWLPVALLLILPLLFMPKLQADFAASFDYSLLDRLMTQSRILWQYIAIIVFPSTSGTSLFHDINVSTGFLSPVSTLVSTSAWLGLIFISILRPGKQRIFLFAVLWFFAGHIIESSVLPLELFFNHRNYLAFFGLVFVALYCLIVLVPRHLLSCQLKITICLLYSLLLIFQTFSIGSLWRDPLRLSESWFLAAPQTARNAEFYAINLAETDFEGVLQAAQLYEDAFNRDKSNYRLLLNRMILSCSTSFISRPDNETILQSLELISKENRDLLSPLQQLVSLTTTNTCNIYSPELLSTIIYSFMEHTTDQFRGLYEFELARLKFYNAETEQGIALLQSAYTNSGDSGILFNLSLQLINSGRYQEALTTIDLGIDRIKSYNNIRSGTRASKLAVLYEMRQDVTGFLARQ